MLSGCLSEKNVLNSIEIAKQYFQTLATKRKKGNGLRVTIKISLKKRKIPHPGHFHGLFLDPVRFLSGLGEDFLESSFIMVSEHYHILLPSPEDFASVTVLPCDKFKASLD